MIHLKCGDERKTKINYNKKYMYHSAIQKTNTKKK